MFVGTLSFGFIFASRQLGFKVSKMLIDASNGMDQYVPNATPRRNLLTLSLSVFVVIFPLYEKCKHKSTQLKLVLRYAINDLFWLRRLKNKGGILLLICSYLCASTTQTKTGKQYMCDVCMPTLFEFSLQWLFLSFDLLVVVDKLESSIIL